MKEQTVAYQQGLVDALLHVLEAADPYCILAGGAPRDWYFGNKANDFDIYFVGNAVTVSGVGKQLDRALSRTSALPVKPRSNHLSDLYKHMRFLRRIWDTEVDGIPVNLIELEKAGDQFKVVNGMDCSICKVWYKNMKIVPTREFLLGEKTKTIVLNEGYSWGDPHPQKMKKRFPEYKLIGREGFEKTMLSKYQDILLEE